MEKEALTEVLATNQPFRIITSSGQQYLVSHPDFVSVAPGQGSTVIVFGEDGIGLSLLDLRTISDIQIENLSAN